MLYKSYCRNFTVLTSFFDIEKERPKTDLKKSSQCIVDIEILIFPSNVKS